MAESKKHRAALRMFQFRGEEEYFFIEFNSKYIYFICKESEATPKEYNLKRLHFVSQKLQLVWFLRTEKLM